MEERYGKRRAELVMKRMLQHYRRLAFIDLLGEQNRVREAYLGTASNQEGV